MDAAPLQRPFWDLELAPETPLPGVLARGRELQDENQDQESLSRTVAALDQLRNKPMDRLLHELFEVPRPAYLRGVPGWERFLRANRRAPTLVHASAGSESPPPFGALDLPALLSLALQGHLAGPAPTLDAALDEAPTGSTTDRSPLGVHDALFT